MPEYIWLLFELAERLVRFFFVRSFLRACLARTAKRSEAAHVRWLLFMSSLASFCCSGSRLKV
ncbi:hypothetical protein ATO50_07790 [Aeromonas hydrophila]|nr:hypothetical protein ATO50_07790 [Aeromonas hydrophila]